MSTTFKNSVSGNIGTSLTGVYTTPGGTATTIIGLSLANVSASVIYPSVKVTKGATVVHVVKGVPIPVGSSLVIFGGEQKLVLMAGDVISVISDVTSSVDAILSFIEVV
jgi:hypothetical protein